MIKKLITAFTLTLMLIPFVLFLDDDEFYQFVTEVKELIKKVSKC